MSPPKILIRADAGIKLGGGHISRCLALAERLQSQGFEILFAGNEDAISYVQNIPDYKNYRLKEQTALTRIQKDAQADILLVDHYGWRTQDFAKAKTLFNHIVVLDDSAQRNFPVDMIINQNIGATALAYESKISRDTKILAGPEYALIASAFQNQRSTIEKSQPREIRRIVVTLGLSDQSQRLQPICRLLDAVFKDVTINLVRGNSRIDPNSLSRKNDWVVSAQEKNLAELTAFCDLWLGAGGVSNLERACLGKPALLFALVDNQMAAALHSEKTGSAKFIDARSSLPEKRIKQALHQLKDISLRQSMAECAFKLCDGQGTRRVAAEIQQLLISSSF